MLPWYVTDENSTRLHNTSPQNDLFVLNIVTNDNSNQTNIHENVITKNIRKTTSSYHPHLGEMVDCPATAAELVRYVCDSGRINIHWEGSSDVQFDKLGR